MRKEDFITQEIFEEIEEVGFVSKFIKGTYTEIDGILYDLHIPTYSEVFAWFRNKHKIFITVKDESVRDIIYFQVYFRYYMNTRMFGQYNCHEEGELAALEYIMTHFRVMILERKSLIESQKEEIDFD